MGAGPLAATLAEALPWHASDLGPVVLFTVAAAAYVAYHFGASAAALRRFAPPRLAEEARDTWAIYAQRAAGAILLGVVPAGIVGLVLGSVPWDYGLALGPAGPTLAWIGGPLLVLGPVLFAASRRPAEARSFPRLKVRVWTPRIVAGNSLTWAVYLLGYELFFRGLLLLHAAAWFGPWPGLAVVTALYTWAHLPTEASEAAGCVVMGFVFGAMTLHTGSVVSAFVLHLIIANGAELMAVRNDPTLRFGRAG